MKVRANCKINIGLRVVRKRADGYHDLDTLFFPVYGLYDELEISPAEDVSFVSDGIVIDCNAEDNLVLKCYRLMTARYPQIGKVKIVLHKHIPFGAGLGGGSSDAAHTAIVLNQLFGLGLGKEELAKIVRELGADCPFFIYNTPCLAKGVGDELTPIDFSLAGKRLVMIKPSSAVSTKEAYSGLVPSGKELGDIANWQSWVNDFETTVFTKYPELGAIKKRLLEAGAYYASMSGSGSTIFGLFENNSKGCAPSDLRLFEEEFSPMIIFNNTL